MLSAADMKEPEKKTQQQQQQQQQQKTKQKQKQKNNQRITHQQNTMLSAVGSKSVK